MGGVGAAECDARVAVWSQKKTEKERERKRGREKTRDHYDVQAWSVEIHHNARAQLCKYARPKNNTQYCIYLRARAQLCKPMVQHPSYRITPELSSASPPDIRATRNAAYTPEPERSSANPWCNHGKAHQKTDCTKTQHVNLISYIHLQNTLSNNTALQVCALSALCKCLASTSIAHLKISEQENTIT